MKGLFGINKKVVILLLLCLLFAAAVYICAECFLELYKAHAGAVDDFAAAGEINEYELKTGVIKHKTYANAITQFPCVAKTRYLTIL